MASPGGIEVSRISTRVVPDTSHLFADLKADLERIERDLSVNVKASVDAAELTASAREAVAQAQALAGNIDVKANVDSSQVGQIESVFKRASSGAAGLLSNFSALGAGAAILSTALVPLTAVIAGVGLALAAPLAIAAGGVTIFGFLAGFAVKDTLEQIKQIKQLETKLGTLKKGTQDYNDTLAQLRNAQAAMSPAQTAFAKALDKVKGAFHNLPTSALLKPLTDAMLLLAKVLPKLTPIIGAVSGVFDDLVKSLSGVVSSPGFKKFVQAFAHDLGRDLRAFADIAGNIAVGLGGLFQALDDTLSRGVLKGLENLTGKFANFGRTAADNKGLRSFVNYVKQNMPAAGKLISGLLSMLGDVFRTLAPVGSAVLGALSGIVEQFQRLGQLSGPLAATLGAFGIGSFFGGPSVGATAAAVVGLVGAFEALYHSSKPLRNIIHDLGDYFEKTWLPRIKDAAQQVMPAFQSAVKDVSDTIRDNKGVFEVLGKTIVALGSAAVIGAIGQLAVVVRGIGKAFKYGTDAVKLFANVTLTLLRLIVRGNEAVVVAVLAQFGTIVDAAAAAFGWMPGIGGKVKAAKAAFDDFTSHITGKFNAAADTLKRLQDQINEVGRSHPRFRIDSNTLAEIAHMHELQRLQIADKDFKITAHIEEQIERSTGPGGGMGRPGDLAPRTSSDRSGSSGAGINIQNATFTDARDLSRQAAKWRRGRAGGGVSLRVSPAVG